MFKVVLWVQLRFFLEMDLFRSDVSAGTKQNLVF